jgi:hypothetical protein
MSVSAASARFWAKVQKGTGEECWLFTGAKTTAGYGSLQVRRDDGGWRRMLAHRLSYEMHCGAIPAHHEILHGCDVPACVNPAHLSLGTHADNMADMSRKGRAARGERQPRHKLTAGQVADIRRLCEVERQCDIAARYGVSRSLVSRIKSGSVWGWL